MHEETVNPDDAGTSIQIQLTGHSKNENWYFMTNPFSKLLYQPAHIPGMISILKEHQGQPRVYRRLWFVQGKVIQTFGGVTHLQTSG